MAILTKINAPFEYEPKLLNRFVLQFGENDFIETWAVETVGLPDVSINKVNLEYMNMKTYVAGKAEWSEISIKCKDFIGPSISQQLIEWVRLHIESVNGRMGYAFGYLKDLYLRTLDPTGIAIQEWKLHKCMITKASFGGSHDQSSDALLMPEFSVQPQWCQLLY